ncbi:MAG: FAD-dependent oxidoreductase [Spirochaetes bacterium]|nr:FAD-dependent oxidoreductase [Spirochaetota bacterium]
MKIRQQVPAHPMKIDPSRHTVVESPRQTRVRGEYDVLVAGGGAAGIGAALAAARSGAKTVLLERHGMLGGVWTAGLLNPLFDWQKKGWLVDELVTRLKARGAWTAWKPERDWWCFDTEVMKNVLDQWFLESGIEVLFHAPVVDAITDGGRVQGAVIESKAGREALLAKVSIDASGDGDLAAFAGAAFDLGREVDGLCQPMTLMFEIDGLPPAFNQETSEWLHDALAKSLRELRLPYALPFGRVNYAPWIINLPRAGAAAVQHTHHYRVGALDTAATSLAMMEGRRLAAEAVEIMRGIPGLEKVRLVQTAAAMGIREARRIAGAYRLSMEDLQAGRRFDDAVTTGGFGVDIHEPAPGAGVPSGHHAPMKAYEIPYRCLVPSGVDGLLTAGRCISGSHEAHASYRVTGTAMGMGQGAGLAAAWAAKEGRSVGTLDGAELRRRLAERGAIFLG